MTSKEIEELAGHRQVPAWVVKLVSDAVAIEREACAKVCEAHADMYSRGMPQIELQDCAAAIRARG